MDSLILKEGESVFKFDWSSTVVVILSREPIFMRPPPASQIALQNCRVTLVTDLRFRVSMSRLEEAVAPFGRPPLLELHSSECDCSNF